MKSDPSSLLLFSGGETRRDVGPISEAASYYFLAKHNHWLPEGDNVENPRTFLEEFARDSFENLLFSLCRFREITGRYPAKVTVVGFDFKSKRFTDLHAKALGIPYHRFQYVGLQPTCPNFDHAKAERGEMLVRKNLRPTRTRAANLSKESVIFVTLLKEPSHMIQLVQKLSYCCTGVDLNSMSRQAIVYPGPPITAIKRRCKKKSVMRNAL